MKDGLIRRVLNMAYIWAVSEDRVHMGRDKATNDVVSIEFQPNDSITRQTLYLTPEQAIDLGERLIETGHTVAAKGKDDA